MRLGDFAESVDYGVTASASKRQVGPKFLRITDIQNGEVNWESVPWCACDSRTAIAARLKSGDILFARTGATTGKSFLIRECPSDTVFASYLIRVRVGRSADPRFISHFFRTPDYWAQIKSRARGVAQPGVNASRLKDIEIPLPPLIEQQRIAQVLDSIDSLRARRRAAVSELDLLPQSIFADLFGNLATSSKHWPTTQLGEQTLKIGSGSTPTGGESAYKTEGIALIRSLNVRDGVFSFKDLCFIDNEQARKLAGVIVEADDVLLNITGASVARVCRAPASVLPARVNQHVCIIRPKPPLNPIFLEQLLLNAQNKNRLLKISTAGATREAITKLQLEQFEMIYPPTAFQDEFARRVKALQKLKKTQRESLVELDALFASVQYRAFRGEL